MPPMVVDKACAGAWWHRARRAAGRRRPRKLRAAAAGSRCWVAMMSPRAPPARSRAAACRESSPPRPAPRVTRPRASAAVRAGGSTRGGVDCVLSNRNSTNWIRQQGDWGSTAADSSDSRSGAPDD